MPSSALSARGSLTGSRGSRDEESDRVETRVESILCGATCARRLVVVPSVLEIGRRVIDRATLPFPGATSSNETRRRRSPPDRRRRRSRRMSVGDAAARPRKPARKSFDFGPRDERHGYGVNSRARQVHSEELHEITFHRATPSARARTIITGKGRGRIAALQRTLHFPVATL